MTYHVDDEIEILAPIDAVWRVYADVEHWPDWTESVREARFIEGDRVAVGARVRIRQPKLRTAVWTVASVDQGRSWTWESHAPGVRSTAVHILEPLDATRTRVRQRIEHRGPLSGVVGRLYARLTRDYLAMEAAGLKHQVEARARA